MYVATYSVSACFPIATVPGVASSPLSGQEPAAILAAARLRTFAAGLHSFVTLASGQLTPRTADSAAVTMPSAPINKNMRMRTLWLALTLTIASPLHVRAQYANQDSTFKRYFVGSTLFMLANLVPDNNPPDLLYLNVGYRMTGKDVVSLELKTWRYGWPIGIPYGNKFEAEGEGFPGYIREHGVSLNYQRFFRTRGFAQIDVMPAWQTFVDDRGATFDKGFQVFNTYSLGYHIKLFRDKAFFQPSIAITHRPYQSRMPASFKQVDDRWPRWFYGQPGLHFGYNF